MAEKQKNCNYWTMNQINKGKRPITVSSKSSKASKKRIFFAQPKSKETFPTQESPILELFENIPLDDPIWSQIVPESILKSGISLEQLIEDNPEYFNHHLGLCACFKCKCGRCKCDIGHQVKLRVANTQVTIYGRDYNKKCSAQDMNNILPLNESTYQTQFLEQKSIDLQSQHQYSYKKNPIQAQQRQKPVFIPTQGSVGNLSTYRSTYTNWGVHDFGIMKRPQHVSTSSEIPFLGRSSYQDNFCQNIKQKGNDPMNFRTNLYRILSPLPSGPFMGQTTHSKAFTPFRIQKCKVDQEKRRYETTPIYEGQFESVQTKDYRGKGDEICPANYFNKMWKKKLMEKYNKVRSSKLQEIQ